MSLVTHRKLLWFREHASLLGARWSHNGNHRQKCRLTGQEDDRLGSKQTTMLWMFARLKCHISVPCISLWNSSRRAYSLKRATKNHHTVPGNNKHYIGKTFKLLFFLFHGEPFSSRLWGSVTGGIISFPQQEQHGLVQLFVWDVWGDKKKNPKHT